MYYPIFAQILILAQQVTPYNDSELDKKGQVTQMFDNISGNYDSLNRVISGGLDVKWRKRLIKMVKATDPKRILDVATGTGDLAIAFAKNTSAQVTGLDISAGMLEVAKKKVAEKGLSNRVNLVLGDGEQLPFEDNHFDAVSISFGVRNFGDLKQGLDELNRVLKPNGILAVLETSVPTKFPTKQFYNLYTKNLLPLIGRLFSKDKKAYGYLSESAAAFPHGKAFNNILAKSGFIRVENKPQTFGVATIYVASK